LVKEGGTYAHSIEEFPYQQQDSHATEAGESERTRKAPWESLAGIPAARNAGTDPKGVHDPQRSLKEDSIMATGAKSNQRKSSSASGRAQRASSQANAPQHGRGKTKGSTAARVKQRPGVRASQADATAYTKSGDFPTVGRTIRPAKKRGQK
jgi:hypothetical protein